MNLERFLWQKFSGLENCIKLSKISDLPMPGSAKFYYDDKIWILIKIALKRLVRTDSTISD
jgi:hypothetical protein